MRDWSEPWMRVWRVTDLQLLSLYKPRPKEVFIVDLLPCLETIIKLWSIGLVSINGSFWIVNNCNSLQIYFGSAMQLIDKIAMIIHDCAHGYRRQPSRLFQRLAYFAFHQSYFGPYWTYFAAKAFLFYAYFMQVWLTTCGTKILLFYSFRPSPSILINRTQ